MTFNLMDLGLVNDADRLKKIIRLLLEDGPDFSSPFVESLSDDFGELINGKFINDFAVLLFKKDEDIEEGSANLFMEIRSRTFINVEIASSDYFSDYEVDHFHIDEISNEISSDLLRQLSNFNCRKIKICSSCLCQMIPDEKKFCYDCELKVCTFNDEVCSICLDKEETVSVWNVLKTCKHIFHQSCFKSLIGNSISNHNELLCPICREIVGIHSVKIL